MPILPLTTERLTLRLMRTSDANTLATYRNDPDTARYQSWPLPYTPLMAADLLVDQADTTDIGPDGWLQVAIDLIDPGHESPATMIGDLAVGLEQAGAIASIGYTLAPDRRGHGYATEAAAALIEALFTHTQVHRVVATLDPQNTSSERLLERLGFQREGVARQAAFVGGQWVDDLTYSLLRSDSLLRSGRFG